MGKLAVSFIVATALLAGGFLWYTAEQAFYEPVVFQPGAEVRLVSLTSGLPEAILASDITGTDATSSPIKFRACFTTSHSQAMLTETYQPYPGAEPLIAPSSFDCFDAGAIGKALETGEALAFLSEPGIQPGIDRVVAVFGDGRGYAWQQLTKIPKD